MNGASAVAAPPLVVGVQISHVPGTGPGCTADLVEDSHTHGFEAVTVALSPTTGVPAPEDMREIGARARHLGLRVELVLGSVGPADDPRHQAATLGETLAVARLSGAEEIAVYTRSDRRATSPSHHEQLAAVSVTLGDLAHRADDLGCHLNLKTHEDLSSHEVLALVQEVGTELAGVSLDVANLVVRGEDPVAATRRLAPFVRQTHLEDVALYAVERGLRRRLVPCGTGVLDWGGILAALQELSPARQLTLERHRGRFDVGISDPDWYAAEPHVTGADIAALLRMGRATDAARRQGRLPDLAAYDVDRSPDEECRDLTASAAYLRSLLVAEGGGHS
jgi:3-oxoisoapionate decarboxylase